MQLKKLYIASILLIGIFFTGFQCSSTELTSAKLYIQQKNYDKAVESLKKEVEKNPQSDEGYYLLGAVYAETEQYDNMIDAFDKSVAISDKYAQTIRDYRKQNWVDLHNRGVNFFNRGTNTTNKDSSEIYFNKAITSFNQAIKVEPDSAETYKTLAFVYMRNQKYDEAMVPLQKLIDKEQSLDGYKFLGEIIYVKGNELKNKYQETKNVQDSLEALDYFNKAVNILEQARKKYPDDEDILLTLSNAYIGANKIDVAMDAFKAGVEKDPTNQYYRYNYGVLLLGSDDFQGAEQQFLKAVEIDSNYENANYNLAVTYVKWGANLSKEADEKGQMGSTEYKEKYQKALPYLEKVAQMKKEDPVMWELLGKVYTVLGMQDDAQNAFNKADQLRK